MIVYPEELLAARVKELEDEKNKLGNLLLETADRHARAIVALETDNERLREALGLADAALRGANMDMNVVERKVAAALGKAEQ